MVGVGFIRPLPRQITVNRWGNDHPIAAQNIGPIIPVMYIQLSSAHGRCRIHPTPDLRQITVNRWGNDHPIAVQNIGPIIPVMYIQPSSAHGGSRIHPTPTMHSPVNFVAKIYTSPDGQTLPPILSFPVN
jgi:uncharacterized phage-associated protein